MCIIVTDRSLRSQTGMRVSQHKLVRVGLGLEVRGPPTQLFWNWLSFFGSRCWTSRRHQSQQNKSVYVTWFKTCLDKYLWLYKWMLEWNKAQLPITIPVSQNKIRKSGRVHYRFLFSLAPDLFFPLQQKNAFYYLSWLFFMTSTLSNNKKAASKKEKKNTLNTYLVRLKWNP